MLKSFKEDNPANMRRWPNIGSLLGQRCRRWAKSKPTFSQRLMFSRIGQRHRTNKIISDHTCKINCFNSSSDKNDGFWLTSVDASASPENRKKWVVHGCYLRMVLIKRYVDLYVHHQRIYEYCFTSLSAKLIETCEFEYHRYKDGGLCQNWRW